MFGKNFFFLADVFISISSSSSFEDIIIVYHGELAPLKRPCISLSSWEPSEIHTDSKSFHSFSLLMKQKTFHQRIYVFMPYTYVPRLSTEPDDSDNDEEDLSFRMLFWTIPIDGTVTLSSSIDGCNLVSFIFISLFLIAWDKNMKTLRETFEER